MCETLMPVVMAPEAHQNNHSYVCELSGPTLESLLNNLAWWVVTRRTSIKIGWWMLVQAWVLAWDNFYVSTRVSFRGGEKGICPLKSISHHYNVI